MFMENKSVKDFEDVFDLLLGILTQTKNGNNEDFDMSWSYARRVLEAASKPLIKLGVYEVAKFTLDESERLILAGEFEKADQLLLTTVRDIMEKSGTNKRLRKLYESPTDKTKIN